jgi:hypothetical protein
MTGTKAQALAEWAWSQGRAFIRFDYFGHGESSGDFAQGTVTRWREDALAVIDELTARGAGAGGLVHGRLDRLPGGDGAAAADQGPGAGRPGPDFTEKLMAPGIPPEGQAALARDGVWLRPSQYGDPYPITAGLLDDGARWSILDGEPAPIDVRCGSCRGPRILMCRGRIPSNWPAR